MCIPNYDISRSLGPAFEFIAGPIQQLTKEYTSLSKLLKVLCVLAIRFRRTYIHSSMDWHEPFNVEVSFIKELFNSSASPVEIASILTSSNLDIFKGLKDINDEKRLERQYLANWHLLSLSVLEFCLAFPGSIAYIQSFAEVSVYLSFPCGWISPINKY